MNGKKSLGLPRLKATLALLAVFATAAALTPADAPAFPLESAQLYENGGEAVLRIDGADATLRVPYEVFCLENPYRVVVDIFGADAPVAVEAPSQGLVTTVRTSVWKDDPTRRIVRYVMETDYPVLYHADATPGGLRVVLNREGHLRESPEEATDAILRAVTIAPEDQMEGTDLQTAASENIADLSTGLVTTDIANERVDASDLATSYFDSVPVDSGPEKRPVLSESDGIDPDLLADGASLPTATADEGWMQQQDAAPILGGGVDPRGTPQPPSPGFPAGGEAGLSWLGQGQAANTTPMSLDVHDADLRTVFRSIARFGDVNIVPDRDVAGPVSIKLVEVPWRQALDIVCQSAGLIAVGDSHGVIRVAAVKTYQAEGLAAESNARKKEDFLPLSTHVFIAGYASASDLVDPISLVLSARGTVNHDSRTNSVIVTDIDARIDRISKLIHSLDTETQQVEITARLVDIDATATRQLGITWGVNNLADAGEGLTGSFGVTEPLLDSAGTIKFGVVRSWGNLDATLEALESDNVANIISNPTITTVNNHPARILVGKEIPLITLDNRGNAITELKKVGITLEVTPFINKDNKITMDLHPEISDLSSQATVQGGLIFTTTEADTRIMVNDGETAVIAGLVRTNETVFEQGIPILKSIPFVGHFFKQSDTRTEKRELMIFVTPRVVKNMASN